MSEWEPVQLSELHSTDRLAVPGGWLYRVRHHTLRFDAQSVVFVPTPPPTAVRGEEEPRFKESLMGHPVMTFAELLPGEVVAVEVG